MGEKRAALSRRDFMSAVGLFAAGGIAGCASHAVSAQQPAAPEPPPLPWKWTKLDPLEAGRRAYRGYLTKPPGG